MRRCVLLLTLAFAVMIVVGGTTTAQCQETLTYADLVGRLVDLEHVAVLPAEGETCAQWSSWDRAAKYDAENDRYVNWSANGDGTGIIRREGDLEVMAEMEGPGCIWRTWSALAQDGHVKIYLDGSDRPAVDLPFKNYFTGDTAPFAYPILSYDLATLGCRGHNLYVPIPYQKSCKIVAERGWGRYYQFVYTTYPKGTKLPTFSTELAAENAASLEAAARFLSERLGTDPAGRRDGEETVRDKFRLGPGETESLEIPGPRAIAALRGRLFLEDRKEQMAAARQLALKISFDAAEEPQVWCPVGDFFGTAPGYNEYKSLPTGMADGWGYALWYMPFAQGAKLELVNEGDVARDVEFEIVHAPLGRPFEGLGHFHCKWHRDTIKLPEDRWPDWPLLMTEGRGRYCGVMLHVWNPRGGWWGEGDEKFFVDGEKYPSTFGTGSEDYFGYAWCNPGLFQRPFHCQTMTMGNQGHQSVLRWQIGDNVPFHTSFEGTIEKYYRTEERGTQYASTVAWYLAPGGQDPYGPVAVEDRHDYYVKSPILAGGFKVLGDAPGTVRTQGLTQFPDGNWKNDDHLWWTGAKPGDKLEVAVPVKKSGTCQVSVVLTKARDYGIVQFYLDGKKAGEPIDLYNPTVVNTEPIAIGTHELAEGEHTLGVEIVGKNEKAVPSYMFGMDYVVFETPK